MSVKILLVFGASLKIVDLFRQTPYDMIADEEGPLRNLMDTFVANPGFIKRYSKTCLIKPPFIKTSPL